MEQQHQVHLLRGVDIQLNTLPPGKGVLLMQMKPSA